MRENDGIDFNDLLFRLQLREEELVLFVVAGRVHQCVPDATHERLRDQTIGLAVLQLAVQAHDSTVDSANGFTRPSPVGLSDVSSCLSSCISDAR